MNSNHKTCMSADFLSTLPRKNINGAIIFIGICLFLQVSTASSSPYDQVITEESLEQEKPYSPYIGRAYPDQV
jgi:hypothetical protein